MASDWQEGHCVWRGTCFDDHQLPHIAHIGRFLSEILMILMLSDHEDDGSSDDEDESVKQKRAALYERAPTSLLQLRASNAMTMSIQIPIQIPIPIPIPISIPI